MTDSDSEFGYDFSVEEEELLAQLASKTPTTPRQKSPPLDVKLAVIDSVPARSNNVICGDGTAETRHLLALDLEGSKTNHIAEQIPATVAPALSTIPNGQDVCYPDLRGALSTLEADAQRPVKDEPGCDTTADDRSFGDDRTPLQRFRSYPRKPLTVSDLNAGAWCELQYWYTLTRLPGGRRTRTAAMRQGTKVHQKLEDEVHTTVKIDIASKEDGFGLKLWNLVQGLRTLRETGLTRELEVWGMIDGNLVNGVIDGVSYENPNPEFEEELSSQGSQGNQRQSQLTDYYPPTQSEQVRRPGPKIYLTDVKTRGSLAPVSKAQLRPAKIQLLLYHRFLSGMAAGELDFLKVFRRYGLDPDDPFSDAFIAQIGSLHDEIFFDAASPSEREFEMVDTSLETESVDATKPDLLKYRTLRELIPLVDKELASTFPYGEDSMGHMLRVQYVHRSDGRDIDVHDFPVSRHALDAYLSKYMAWWRGERKASGVDIEEAFKCQTCEFVSDCSWRQGMDGERLRKAQQKQRVRAMRRD